VNLCQFSIRLFRQLVCYSVSHSISKLRLSLISLVCMWQDATPYRMVLAGAGCRLHAVLVWTIKVQLASWSVIRTMYWRAAHPSSAWWVAGTAPMGTLYRDACVSMCSMFSAPNFLLDPTSYYMLLKQQHYANSTDSFWNCNELL
jgi:hypothetical protein